MDELDSSSGAPIDAEVRICIKIFTRPPAHHLIGDI